MTPKWFQLIKALLGYPEIARENLTIAFLVGAVRTSLENRTTSPETGRRELFDLLTSFVNDAPREYVVSIFRCAYINQPVVRLINSANASSSPLGLDSVIQHRQTVLLDSDFAFGQPSIEALTDQLFQELGNAICEGRFSFRSGNYHFFDGEELAFIEETIRL